MSQVPCCLHRGHTMDTTVLMVQLQPRHLQRRTAAWQLRVAEAEAAAMAVRRPLSSTCWKLSPSQAA